MTFYHFTTYLIALINNPGKSTASALARTIGDISHDFLTDILKKDWDGTILLWYCIQRIHPLTQGWLVIDDSDAVFSRKAFRQRLKLLAA